jgi:adenine-specific DNA-methyltransferase
MESLEKLCKALNCSVGDIIDFQDSAHQLKIQNRRYLGNKYKLLDFIEDTINKHCPNTHSLMDVFAGTGVVAYHFMDKMQVVTNDTLYSNYLAHIAFMSADNYDTQKIRIMIDSYNDISINAIKDNYMSDTFGDTFFCKDDCKRIGYIREDIQKKYISKKINQREMAILITSLLYSMDKVANTCGHYDAYRKGVEYDRRFELLPLDLSKKSLGKNIFFNADSNVLAIEGKLPYVDCVYCDPPYNSRNYCDLYHVLENVAQWKKPDVKGEARKMDRAGLKSRYCSKSAAIAFEELVKVLNCKYIVLSYNNTGDKANDRSNARMNDADIMRILSEKGQVKVYSQKYKAFTTGKSDNYTNEERLFVCEVS